MREKQTMRGLGIDSVGSPLFEEEPAPPTPSLGAKLKRKKSKMSPADVPTPVFGSPDPNAPRQSWFAGLFNWRQLSYTLQSVESVTNTQYSCKRILESLGVTVILENKRGVLVLKCHVQQLFDGHVSTGLLKPVKFRVDFQQTSSPSPSLSPNPLQYPTTVTLVMEKGAHSTFKATYNRLRTAWELDNPLPTHSPRMQLDQRVRIVPSPILR